MNKLNLYELSEELLKEIEPQVKKVELVGSIRRKVLNPGDIDFVIIPFSNKETELKSSVRLNWKGNIKIQHELSNEVKVDFLFTTEESFGAAIMHFTGSQRFNIRTRSYAKSMGMRLNEYGLFNSVGECIASKTEEEIFNALGLEYKIPSERK